jgi:hypothetical protein
MLVASWMLSMVESWPPGPTSTILTVNPGTGGGTGSASNPTPVFPPCQEPCPKLTPVQAVPSDPSGGTKAHAGADPPMNVVRSSPTARP